jgi:hypothetical protein
MAKRLPAGGGCASHTIKAKLRKIQTRAGFYDICKLRGLAEGRVAIRTATCLSS